MGVYVAVVCGCMFSGGVLVCLCRSDVVDVQVVMHLFVYSSSVVGVQRWCCFVCM